MSDQPYMPTKAKSEEWGTPPEIFDTLNAEFGFKLDAAASHENHLCPHYYDKADNGAVKAWFPGPVFCNPPYNVKALDAFARKALNEAQKGITSVLLVPAKTDQAWWHLLWKARNSAWASIEFRFIKGRVRYVGASNSATFPSVVIVVRPAP